MARHSIRLTSVIALAITVLAANTFTGCTKKSASDDPGDLFVVSHTPINNIGGQYRNQTIDIEMSTAVDPNTINSTSIKITTGSSGSSTVLGTFTLLSDQKTIRFKPALAYGPAGTQVNIWIDTIDTQATPDESELLKSAEGRNVISKLADDPDPFPALDIKFFCGSFLEVDTLAPTVQSVVPVPGNSVADNWPNIVITFSEPMNANSFTLDTTGAIGSFNAATDTIRVEQVNTVAVTGTKVDGTLEWNNINTVLTFTPFVAFTTNREIRLFLRSMDPATAAASSCNKGAPPDALTNATYNTILDIGHPDDCFLGNRLDVPGSISAANMTETGASTFILTSTFTTFTAPSKIQGSVSEPFDNNNNESVLLTTAEWSNFIIDGTGAIISQGLAESRRTSAGKNNGSDAFPGGTDLAATNNTIGNLTAFAPGGIRVQFLYLPTEFTERPVGGGLLTNLGWRHLGPTTGATTDPTPPAGITYDQHLTIKVGHAADGVETSERLSLSYMGNFATDEAPVVVCNTPTYTVPGGIAASTDIVPFPITPTFRWDGERAIVVDITMVADPNVPPLTPGMRVRHRFFSTGVSPVTTGRCLYFGGLTSLTTPVAVITPPVPPVAYGTPGAGDVYSRWMPMNFEWDSVNTNTSDTGLTAGVISANTVRDTSVAPFGVYNHTSFSVQSGVTLSAAGAYPLVIRATKGVSIAGTVSVSGSAGLNGGSAGARLGGAGGASGAGNGQVHILYAGAVLTAGGKGGDGAESAGGLTSGTNGGAAN
jgi:hypothetical protein